MPLSTIHSHHQTKWRDRSQSIALWLIVLLLLLLFLHEHGMAQGIKPTGNNVSHVICDSGCSGSGGGSAITSWGGGTLGAMAAYGTSPGAVLVPGVNAFITNTVPVTGTFWQATQPVSGTFWQATQPVSIASMPSTPVTGTFWQATQPVSGTFWQATQPVSIASMPSTPVTGTFWQATQPVSGTFFQATQPVSIASMPSTPVTGTFFQATQPVSGTVTANQGTSPWVANVSQFGGNNVATGTGAGGVGIPRVTVSNDSQVRVLGNAGATLDAATNGAIPPNQAWVVNSPTTAAGGAVTASVKATVTASVNVKASAGNVYGLSVANGAAAVCWVQFINSAGAGTLGTGVIFSIALPTSGVVTIPPGMFALSNFSAGIAVGVASSTNSSTACGTGANLTVFFD